MRGNGGEEELPPREDNHVGSGNDFLVSLGGKCRYLILTMYPSTTYCTSLFNSRAVVNLLFREEKGAHNGLFRRPRIPEFQELACLCALS